MKILKTIVALVLALGLGLAMLSSCEPKKPALTKSGLDPAAFVAEVDGIPIGLYTLTNANGMEVCVTNFGGRIVSIMAPDRNGELRDVVLGFDNVQNYMTVPAALKELDKIEIIRQMDSVYRLDHAITATQKDILQAFNLTASTVKKEAGALAKQLSMIKE